MNTRDRQGWTIVATLFVTLFLVFGAGYNTSGLFFTQLVRSFGWTHTRTSSLASILAVSAGVGALPIGWLLDRVETRIVMVTGVVITALSFLLASTATSFPVMFTAYLILGVGIGAATLLPASFIVANWFSKNRGLAMGVTFAGTSLGGAGMTLIGNHAIQHFGGWRAAYVALAIPMIFIVVPLVLWKVRGRPPEARELPREGSAGNLPGFELSEALHTRSFWMISAAQFLFACVVASVGLHLIHYLIELGYTQTFAASIMSTVLAGASLGKFGMGMIADRISARVALSLNFVALALGMVLILGAGSGAVLTVFVALFGLSLGTPLVLIPLVVVDSLGLKRFGTIGGASGIFQTLGATVGPLGTGMIFDLAGGYSPAFEIFVLLSLIGALASLACQPLESEQARLAPAAATA